MKTTKELKELFVSGEKDELLRDIYIDEALLDYQRQRYADAISRYEELYGCGEAEIYSAPGRSEETTRTIRMEKCWPIPSIWTPSES